MTDFGGSILGIVQTIIKFLVNMRSHTIIRLLYNICRLIDLMSNDLKVEYWVLGMAKNYLKVFKIVH